MKMAPLVRGDVDLEDDEVEVREHTLPLKISSFATHMYEGEQAMIPCIG